MHNPTQHRLIDMRDDVDFTDSMSARKKARLDDMISLQANMSGRIVDESKRITVEPRGDTSNNFGPMVQPSHPLSGLDLASLPLSSSFLTQEVGQAMGAGGNSITSSFLSNPRTHGAQGLDSILAARSLTNGSLMQPWSLDPRLHHLSSSLLTPSVQSSLSSQDALSLMRLNLLRGNTFSNYANESQVRLGLAQRNPNLPIRLQNQVPMGATSLSSPLVTSLRNSNSIPGTFGSGSIPTESTTTCVEVSARQLPLPEGDEELPYVSRRVCVPLSTDEDQNWLSEFLCFVRADLVEIFRASKDDVRSRNSSKKVLHGQVGIRCRYCAHLPQSARTSRSSSYPSSLSRIYQSLTMMLRDHFGACNAIPLQLKQRFLNLKGKTSQGATDSKHFWVYSAKKLGLKDSDSGIWIDEDGEEKEGIETTYGASRDKEKQAKQASAQSEVVSLVKAEDRRLVSDFTYELMSHAQLVHMEESERIGNRKSLPVGLPGLGCKHCCRDNRKGLCRLFPARRRTLPSKIHDLYEHVRRCTLCSAEDKQKLMLLKSLESHPDETKILVGEKEFFDRIWHRMGNTSRTE